MKRFSKYEQKFFNFLKSYPFPVGVEIFLFGSRARRDHQAWSDLDLGLENLPQNFKTWELDEKIEDLNLPYDVELVKLDKVSKDFYDKAKSESINLREII